MPTYDYECNECSIVFEIFHKITDNQTYKCPECDGNVKRLISAGIGIIFKGSGFYSTDNKKTSSGSSAGKNIKKSDNNNKSVKPNTKTETTSKTKESK